MKYIKMDDVEEIRIYKSNLLILTKNKKALPVLCLDIMEKTFDEIRKSKEYAELEEL